MWRTWLLLLLVVVGCDTGRSVVGGDLTNVPMGCDARTRFVYVVDSQGNLLSFDPSTLRFQNLGMFRCEGASSQVNSMAVDRSGVAWIGYSNGQLFRVNTETLQCTATSFAPESVGNERYGMGFSTADSSSALGEALYLVSFGRDALLRVDPSTLASTTIGPLQLASGVENGCGMDPGTELAVPLGNSGFCVPSQHRSELTGGRDGQLFALVSRTTPMQILSLDRTNAQARPGVRFPGERGNGWAIALWGGFFWVFTAPQGTGVVTRVHPATGASEVVVPNIGRAIVGAGVSVCAPNQMPSG